MPTTLARLILPNFASWGPDRLRKLPRSELSDGLFRGGAKELHFIDGRTTLTGLAIEVQAIEIITERLQRGQSAASGAV